MKSYVIILCLFLVLVLSFVTHADFIDVGASAYANHSTNITVKGYIKTDASAGINGTLVTGYLGNSNFTIYTNTSNNWSLGYFEFNLTALNSTGRFNITLNTSSMRKTVEIYISNRTTVKFNFTGNKPPFSNGSSFLLNVSYDGLSTVAPRLEIFSANGVNSTGWIMSNLSTRLNTQNILYNITVPSNADGRYVAIFEEGAGSTIFLVKTSLVAISLVEDASNSTTTKFGQNEPIQILGKIRDSNNPITNAAVTAFITLPNGTVTNITLIHNGTGVDGTYNGTINTSSFGSPVGDYKIEIVANVSGKIIRSTSSATVQGLEGKLDIVKDFFYDFGSSSSFQSGGRVDFNFLVYNLSNDILLNGSSTATARTVFCSNITVVQFKNALNGTVLSAPGITNSANTFLGQNVCRINFTAPAVDGVYAITLNASLGTDATNTVLATGYFSVQSYVLKPSPVLSIGGGKEFVSFLMPGDNATFELTVRNLSASGAAIAGNLIMNYNVTRITPMNFVGGAQSEITNIQVIEYSNGSSTTNPKIKIKIPENQTGPFQVEFQATVAGSTIKGNAFYFARYVEGFAFPSSFGGGFGTGGGAGEQGVSEGGGPPGGGPSGGSFKCSGTQVFSAKIFDVRTRQAAQNVVFNSIQQAREEMTGKSVASSLVITSSSSTDSNGFGNLSILFNASTFSGFHFMLINITTSDGKYDTLPAGFECKQMSFFPQIQAIGSSGNSFFVSPTSGVNITVSGIRNLNNGTTVRNGTVTIMRLESFDPGKGPKMVTGFSTTYPLNNGTVAFTAFPANFSGIGGKWFNGFNNLLIRVCDNSSSPAICDNGFGGFMVVAFDAFPDYSGGSPSTTLTAGDNISYVILAKTNVTRDGSNQNTTTTGFTITLGMPWEGTLQGATITNTTLLMDGWNNTDHNNAFTGFERWNVTFTVPTNLRKGGNMITIKVLNYLNETTDVMMFGTASTLSVTVPDTEGIFGHSMSMFVNATNSTYTLANFNINLTSISLTHNVSSRSDRVCVIKNFTVTRFTTSQTQIYNSSTTIVVVDNATAGVYDTIVVNNSGQIGIANNTGVKSLASAGFPGLYLISVEDCGFVKVFNSTVTKMGFGAGFGGSHQINTSAIIPIVIKKGTTARSGVAINISQVVKQQDFGGGQGGFGFTGFLDAGSYRATPGVSDSNGVAFMRFNSSVNGQFSLIWNFTDGSTADTADFSEGIPIEMKVFRTEGGLAFTQYKVVTLSKTDQSYGSNVAGSPIYYALWNESSQGAFVDDGATSNVSIVLRNVTASSGSYVAIPGYTEIVLDDDQNLSTNDFESGQIGALYRSNWTEKLSFFWNSAVTMAVDGNKTIDENTTQLIFGGPNTKSFDSLGNPSNARTIYMNVTVRSCAYTFARPQTSLMGANISQVTIQTFSGGGPPTNEALTIIDPYTNNPVTSVLTGPSGCVTYNVTRSSGWNVGSPYQMRATISSGGVQDQVFVGGLQVSCSGSC